MLIMNRSTKHLKQAYHLSSEKFNRILGGSAPQNPALKVSKTNLIAIVEYEYYAV